MCLEEERSLNALGPDPAEEEDPGAEPVPAVLRLYEACREAFTPLGPPFSPQALQRVRLLLDNIKPSDVGLYEIPPQQKNGGFDSVRTEKRNRARHHSKASRPAPIISYMHIHECDEFSMGIFCLPTSAVIPLHNHPGMTVFSKLLYGSMHVKAYDWVNSGDVTQSRLAKLVVDRTMSAPCEPSVLHPTSGGNIHEFTAVTDCAVLDVLAPPYSAEDGRHCTYYRDIPYSRQAGESSGNGNGNYAMSECQLSWLKESKPPADLLKAAPYMGPRIVP